MVRELQAVQRLNEVVVVPVTRTVRGISTEVLLTQDDGMPVAGALNFDHVSLALRDRIGPLICVFPDSRWDEVRAALLPSHVCPHASHRGYALLRPLQCDQPAPLSAPGEPEDIANAITALCSSDCEQRPAGVHADGGLG
jgi:mRNA-degrading endonuclease toxin of MazEF toxin-antitoxin module